MEKKNYQYTFWMILASHFIISVFMALAYGIRHPLTNLYVPGKCFPYVFMSCLMVVPMYFVMGYLFILSKENQVSMEKVLLVQSINFCIALLVLFGFCYAMVYYGLIRGCWKYYVIMNYPAGLVFNTIRLATDGTNALFLLTAFPGPIGFYLGSICRLKYEKKGKRKSA